MANVTKLPNTTEISFGGITMQCRLSGKATLMAEKRLKESIVGLFVKGEGEVKFPPIHSLLVIIHESNTTSGIKESDIVNAFYKFIDDGGSTMDIFEMVNDMLDNSGFFGKSKDKANEETLDGVAMDSILD